MPPPEVWGPAVWSLFHTLTSQINPNAYPHVSSSMFSFIFRICKYLPCPECASDATVSLARIDINKYKTKESLQDMLYSFHNWVNKKKRKPIYKYIDMNKYSNLNLVSVINTFIMNYHTKGNMNMISESFQRQFVLNDFKKWIKRYIHAFIPDMIVNNPEPVNDIPLIDTVVSDDSKTIDKEIQTVESVVTDKSKTESEEVSEPVNEPVNEPKSEDVNEPVNEPKSEDVNEQVNDPINDPVNDPINEQVNEQVNG